MSVPRRRPAPGGPRPEGELLTFLIADVRGYTRFTQEHGDESAARLAAEFAEIAREGVEARGGSVIELRGDEALAVFASPRQALRAALELQAVFADEVALRPSLPLRVGMGLDIGEAMPVEGGYRGGALNLAARLCARAGPGEVLVSAELAHLARAFDGARYEELGALELKGIERPVRALRLVPDGEAPQGERSAADRVAPTSPAELPPELDPITPLVGRDVEARALRWAWRRARGGAGRAVFVAGPCGAGRTRLVAEPAALAVADGGLVVYASCAAADGSLDRVLASLADRSQSPPALAVIEDLDAADAEATSRIAAAMRGVADGPVLLVATYDQEAADRVQRVVRAAADAGIGTVHRLGPLDAGAVREIATLYADETGPIPVQAILEASQGVAARVHELAAGWARQEAQRRVGETVTRAAAGRAQLRRLEAELTSNVIDLHLARERAVFYAQEPSVPDGAVEAAPFKGLAGFDVDDSELFFGRERLVADFVGHLAGGTFLGVVGPSGSGKSSALRAGLLPALRAGTLPGSERWRQVLLRPGEHPMRELDRRLFAALPESARSALDGGSDSLEAALALVPEDGRLLIAVDQFEECFTLCRDAGERESFIGALVRAARHGRAAVVVGIRADYYGGCAAYPNLAELLGDSHVLVGPMNTEEYRRVIEQPAQRAGLRVEPALVDALVADVVNEAGGLPLLSTALLELWQRRDGRILRLATYEVTGGVRGAVTRLAEDAYGRLSEPQQAHARAILLRLSAGEGDAAVRRRAPLSELDAATNPDVERVLDVLVDARLLTVSEGSIEISHEALLREWPRLRGWLEEDVAGRRLRQHLIEAAREWAASGRDPAELYRGARLAAAVDWHAEHGLELNELERTFLEESRRASQQEADRQRQANRRLRALLGGVVVLLVLSLAGGAYAVTQRAEAERAAALAERQRTIADAERLGAEALAQPNLAVSLLLAREGVELHDSLVTRGNLFSALVRSPAATAIWRPLDGPVLRVDLSSDGRRILVEGTQRVVMVDPNSGVVVRELAVAAASGGFAEDGTMIAVEFGANGDYERLTLYDGDSGAYLRGVELPVDRRGVHWAPDLTSVAWVARDGSSITIRDLATRDERVLPAPPGQEYLDVIQYGDGHLLVTLREGSAPDDWQAAYDEPLTYAWWPPGDATPAAVAHSEGGFEALDVSPDLATLAIGHRDGSITLHSLIGGEPRELRGRHSASTETVSYSPDGRWLISGGRDRLAIVWDVDTGEVRERLAGHTRGIASASIHAADGEVIAYTAGLDGLLIKWDISGQHRLGRRFETAPPGTRLQDPAWSALSPDGRLLAVAADGGSVVVRDLDGFEVVAELRAEGWAWVNDLEFSPDGAVLAATGEGERPVRRWNTADWAPIGPTPAEVPIAAGAFSSAVAFAPDGRTYAASIGPTDVHVGDSATGRPAGEPMAEAAGGGSFAGAFVTRLAFSPDSRLLAVGMRVGSLGMASVWALAERERLYDVDADPGGRFSIGAVVTFTPDGENLVTGGQDGTVRFWDASTGEQSGPPLSAGDDAVYSLSWDPSGRLLATTTADGTVRLFDVAAHAQVGASLPGPQSELAATASFSPDGKRLYVVYSDGSGTVWDVSVERWKEHACAVVGRNLTEAEWERFLPGRPYRPSCPEQP